jgi:hypothetical protein
MAGLVPAIHDFRGRSKDMDGLHKAGHDDLDGSASTPVGIIIGRILFRDAFMAVGYGSSHLFPLSLAFFLWLFSSFDVPSHAMTMGHSCWALSSVT